MLFIRNSCNLIIQTLRTLRNKYHWDAETADDDDDDDGEDDDDDDNDSKETMIHSIDCIKSV